jgi:hypothetical protein
MESEMIRTRKLLAAVGVVAISAIGITLVDTSPALAEPTGVVQTGGPNLNVRDCGGLSCNKVGSLPDGTRVTIYCQVTGDPVYGNWGWTSLWDAIQMIGTSPQFVSDGFVNTGSNGRVAGTCH